MDLNNLVQALQYSVGKTQEEVRMAEQFLSQVHYTPILIPYVSIRPELKKDTFQTFY